MQTNNDQRIHLKAWAKISSSVRWLPYYCARKFCPPEIAPSNFVNLVRRCRVVHVIDVCFVFRLPLIFRTLSSKLGRHTKPSISECDVTAMMNQQSSSDPTNQEPLCNNPAKEAALRELCQATGYALKQVLSVRAGELQKKMVNWWCLVWKTYN